MKQKNLTVPHAMFIGWQEDFVGIDHIPLFNVIWKDHPLHQSTVDANTILRIGLKIPSNVPECPFSERRTQ